VQAHERELEKQKLGYEEEIHKLKQENYVLSAKVCCRKTNFTSVFPCRILLCKEITNKLDIAAIMVCNTEYMNFTFTLHKLCIIGIINCNA
jgi:hypothetical protein